MQLPHFLQGKPMPDTEAIQKALGRYEAIRFMMDTDGWKILMEESKKAEQWEFDQSVSPDFLEKVMFKPAIYAKHTGYVAGLRFHEGVLSEIERSAEKARKDLELLEKYAPKKEPDVIS